MIRQLVVGGRKGTIRLPMYRRYDSRYQRESEQSSEVLAFDRPKYGYDNDPHIVRQQTIGRVVEINDHSRRGYPHERFLAIHFFCFDEAVANAHLIHSLALDPTDRS